MEQNGGFLQFNSPDQAKGHQKVVNAISKAFGQSLNNKQLYTAADVLEIMAQTKGMTGEQYLAKYFADGGFRKLSSAEGKAVLRQSGLSEGDVNGLTQFVTDGKAIVYAAEHGNFSTFVHETFHVLERVTDQCDNLLKAVREAGRSGELKRYVQSHGRLFSDKLFTTDDYGDAVDVSERIVQVVSSWKDDAKLTKAQEEVRSEILARLFEGYLYDGKTFSPKLKTIFAKLVQWMRRVYKGMETNGVTLTDDIVRAYDDLLTRKDSGVYQTVGSEISQVVLAQTHQSEKLTDEQLKERIEKNEKTIAQFRKAVEAVTPNPQMDRDDVDVMSSVPMPFYESGFQDLKIITRLSKIREILFYKHQDAMTKDLMKKVPDFIRDPAVIMNSSHPGSVMVLSAVTANDDNPILISIALDEKFQNIKIDRITSIYGKKKDALNKAYFGTKEVFCYYVDNKQADILRASGLQLPVQEKMSASNKNLVTKEGLVKKYPILEHIMHIGDEIEHQNAEIVSESVKPDVLAQAAYHGSAYLFDKFRTDKVNSGEGSQYFGWGLYFTQSKQIAAEYAQRQGDLKFKDGGRVAELPDLLSVMGGSESLKKFEDTVDRISGKPGRWKEVLDNFCVGIGASDNDILQAIDYASFETRPEGNTFKEMMASRSSGLTGKENAVKAALEDFLNTEEGLRFYDLSHTWGQRPHYVYSVELPDGKYLDWNAPMPEEGRQLIRSRFLQESGESLPDEIEGDPELDRPDNKFKTGRDFYRGLREMPYFRGEPRDISGFLHRLGYAGIVYDAGSIQGGGNGARNLVVFDENDIRITGKTLFQRVTAEQVQKARTRDMERIEKDARGALIRTAGGGTRLMDIARECQSFEEFRDKVSDEFVRGQERIPRMSVDDFARMGLCAHARLRRGRPVRRPRACRHGQGSRKCRRSQDVGRAEQARHRPADEVRHRDVPRDLAAGAVPRCQRHRRRGRAGSHERRIHP